MPKTEASAAPRKVVTPGFDVSEVPAPANLILTGEAKSPKQSADEILSWFGVPPMNISQIGRELTHEDIGEALDLNKPVYAALTFKSSAMGNADIEGAVTIGLKPSTEAKAEIQKRFRLIDKGNGISILESKRHADKAAPVGARDEGDEEEEEYRPKDRCGLFPAYEREALGGIRLVCAESEKALMNLGPYLTRTATRTAPKHDMRFELRVQPLHDSIEQARSMLPMLLGFISLKKTTPLGASTRWLQSLTALADDAITSVEDIDTLELRADTGKEGGTLEAEARLKTMEGTSTKLLLSRADISTPAPTAFFRLPVDASSAWYSIGFDEKLLAPAKAEVRASILDLFQTRKLTAADANGAADTVDTFFHLFSVPHVAASGVDLEGLRAALAKLKKSPKDYQKVSAATTAAGWQVSRLEEPFASASSSWQRWSSLLKKPGVAKLVTDTFEKYGTFDAGTISPASKDLPKGSLRWTGGFSIFEDGNKAKAQKTKVVTFIVPDGDGTMTANGTDETLVKKKLLEALAGTGSGSGQGLDSREGLEELRGARSGAAGFISLRSVTSLAGPFWKILGGGDPSLLADLDGKTPFPWFFQKDVSGPGGKVTFRVRLPKKAAPEILRAVMSVSQESEAATPAPSIKTAPVKPAPANPGKPAPVRPVPSTGGTRPTTP